MTKGTSKVFETIISVTKKVLFGMRIQARIQDFEMGGEFL